jgi:ElaB/YqjD/DUF883 family membrane-anchored ribosome-binding protein
MVSIIRISKVDAIRTKKVQHMEIAENYIKAGEWKGVTVVTGTAALIG